MHTLHHHTIPLSSFRNTTALRKYRQTTTSVYRGLPVGERKNKNNVYVCVGGEGGCGEGEGRGQGRSKENRRENDFFFSFFLRKGFDSDSLVRKVPGESHYQSLTVRGKKLDFLCSVRR